MSNPDRFNVIAICLPLLAGTLLCSGCEDSSAARQAEVQAKLTEVSKSLGESPVIMSATTDQAPADAERKLNDLLTILNDTDDGAAPGQQSAASLLASNVHRKIAHLTLAETTKLEADQRSRRDTLFGLIDAAGQLSAVAGSLETVDTQTQQQHLAANRQSAQARLAAYGEQMAAADAPIAALTSANRADQEQIDQLRAQSNELMREANDLGRAAGYGAYEQSVQLDRDADRVQYDVSQRDLELEFSLRPEQALAQKQADQTQEMIAAIDGSSAAIEGLAQTFGDQARSSRATISQLRQTIVAELDELNGTRIDELQSLYKKAAMQLGAAAQKAESAARQGRNEQAHAGRIGAARASQELGQMHWSVALAWQDHIRLLERIEASSGALESASMVSTQLNAARTARSDARREAKKAYASAHEQLDRITGRAAGPELETLKQNVQAAIDEFSSDDATEG